MISVMVWSEKCSHKPRWCHAPQNLPGSEINIQSNRSGPKANVHSGSNPPSYAHMQLKWETNNKKKECETGTHQAENKKSISLGY